MNQLIKINTYLKKETFQGDYYSSNLDHNLMQSYITKST